MMLAMGLRLRVGGFSENLVTSYDEDHESIITDEPSFSRLKGMRGFSDL